VLKQKGDGVLSGTPFVDQIFEFTGCRVEWHVAEGTETVLGDRKWVKVGTVRGPTHKILRAERVALNVLCRASGIATVCRAMARLARKSGWPGRVSGTRKTTPGFRLVEKYAMLVGGVDTHRMDLSSMIMLKDNHVEACGGDIGAAVYEALRVGGFAVKVEVECQNEAEAQQAIDAGAHIVMLDNFCAADAKAAAENLKKYSPHTIIEVSGGLTISNMAEYFHPSIDVISTSTTSQSVPHVDLSLSLLPPASAPCP